MSEKFRLDRKIGFQNTFYTKCINVIIDSIGPSIILRSIYLGSYMSAHVLLNLLNELVKRDKKLGLPSIWSLFRNKFDTFNNTGAWMLDSIYHMILKLF